MTQKQKILTELSNKIWNLHNKYTHNELDSIIESSLDQYAKFILEMMRSEIPEERKGYFPEHDKTNWKLIGFNECRKDVFSTLLSIEEELNK